MGTYILFRKKRNVCKNVNEYKHTKLRIVVFFGGFLKEEE